MAEAAKVDKTLIEVIDNLRICMEITHDFTQPTIQQPLLHDVINLQQMDIGKIDFDVPIEVLQYIDNGSNPCLYNLELDDTLLNLNQVADSKAESFQFFKSELEREMADQFPESLETYHNIRKNGQK